MRRTVNSGLPTRALMCLRAREGLNTRGLVLLFVHVDVDVDVDVLSRRIRYTPIHQLKFTDTGNQLCRCLAAQSHRRRIRLVVSDEGATYSLPFLDGVLVVKVEDALLRRQ